MKRYILSIFAVVIAVGMVAFTKADKEEKVFATIAFYYMPPGGTDYSQASVQNKSNWTSNPATIETCNGANKACRIDVIDTYTELDGNGVRVFKTSGSTANIVADEGDTEGLFVPVLDSSTGLQNKADRP